MTSPGIVPQPEVHVGGLRFLGIHQSLRQAAVAWSAATAAAAAASTASTTAAARS